MHRVLYGAVMVLTPVVASGAAALGASVCTPIGDGQLRCAIKTISDCDAIEDYPYARNLYCPAAFSAAQTMAAQLKQTLGGVVSTGGFFHYFQVARPPKPQTQTTIACLDTPAPYPSGSRFVVGAGVPLCHLVAFVTSPGPVEPEDNNNNDNDNDNPVPADLRAFPDYFSRLYAPGPPFQLTNFRPGSIFDGLVEELGAAGHDGFIKDYPRFSPTPLYAPDHWLQDPRYKGISGGGGGGWGGEIAILAKDGTTPLVQLSFGGGGGGGLTSSLGPLGTVPTSRLAAGGGGGMQFGNAYLSGQYNGLGLGAGVGSDETQVQYSYNDVVGSPDHPVHQYNPTVIAEYQTQLANLAHLLRDSFRNGKTIVLTGGGGMGAGTEYLMQNAQEFEPHALSTQAGFQFSFEYRSQRSAVSGVTGLLAEQEGFYKLLGDDYEKANRQAYLACGSDYANFECMCPIAHAFVICLAGMQLAERRDEQDEQSVDLSDVPGRRIKALLHRAKFLG